MKKNAPDVLLDKAPLTHEEEIRRNQNDWLRKKRLK